MPNSPLFLSEQEFRLGNSQSTSSPIPETTLLELQTTTRYTLMRVPRAHTPPVAIPVHCDLSLFHHPSHRVDYSPSRPFLRRRPQAPKADPSSESATTTITPTGLPPNIVKTNRHLPPSSSVLARSRVYSKQQDGRRSDVVFADVHGVKRTLYACAEQPLRLCGQEIIVFRRYSKMNRGMEVQ
ncbi:hypothetical protein F5888DRAFT_911301 [Russula emetica]|nr:hypothetical protein F5888DRAFT_911301 [Russula emetica]